MAEEANAPQAEGGPDPVAIGAALGRASSTVDAELIAYLHDQRHHLHVQLRPAVWEKWLGVFLRVATACIGMAFAGGVAWMVWEAAHANGLKVEPFSVPPDLAAQGMTGEVVATRVIDRLSQLQAQTNTQRPARTFSNAWGDKAVKLEIPETGVSLSELDGWLREKLGHETRLTGEIVRTKDGVTLTARVGEDGAESVSGPDADIDALVGRLAEAIYRLTQPYRYAAWIYRHEKRPADALPIFRDLTQNGSPDDRLWSYNMWAQTAGEVAGDNEVAMRMYRAALAADPDAIGVYSNLAPLEADFGHWEEAVQTFRERHVHLANGRQHYVVADQVAVAEQRGLSDMNSLIGAYHDAALVQDENRRTGVPGQPLATTMLRQINSHSGEHDFAAARTAAADLPASLTNDRYRLVLAFKEGDWRAALGLADVMAAYLKANPHDRHWAIAMFAPTLALAQAHLGDFTAAERSIAPTRADCYPCLIARAQIAEMQGQRGRADFWFAHADEAGPSLPFAFHEEGKALLGRGKPDDAIARFTIANQKTPHFADPLEGWGEALVAKNQSYLAVAKFAEAEKYAPNWGRLQLKWGEALAYTGQRDEAAKHFARAATLDLTPSETTELRSFSGGTH